MRKLFIFLMLMGIVSIASAQVSGYTFSQTNSTYDSIVGGKVLGSVTTAAGTYFTDSTATAGSTSVTTGIGLPIGFTFNYNGSNFDVFGVNADGWIAFGQSSLTPSSVNMNSSAVNNPISATSTAPATLQNRVCAFGRGILAQPVSRLRYKTMGTAPNRMLVVEWRNYKRSGGAANTDTLNFQIRLTETANTVEFIYGKMKVSSAGGSTVQVGLRGQANTDFNNRATTNNWAATTPGGANNSTCTISTTNYPASGTTFIWSSPLAVDAGVTIINSPAAIISSGLQKIAVTIKDFGTDSLKNTTIRWSVNGTLQTPYSWSGAIAHGATNGPDTIGTYTFTAGNYTVKAWTYNPNGVTDLNNINDTTTKVIYVQAYAPIPFNEGNDSTWVNKLNTRDVPSVYWINTAYTGNNSWRRDDDGTAAAWTNTTGNYTPAGANNTIHSARFHSSAATAGTSGTLDAYLNFTTVGTKILKFWYINTSGNDSLALYISNDGGTTFTYLTKYTTAAIWTLYSYTLGTSVSATTVLRFKASSVGVGNTTDIGIDDVQIYLQPANDMEAYAWVSPASGCGLTNTSTITVKAINRGTNAQSNIPVKYSIDGGSTFAGTEYIPGPVNPGDTVTYTFTGTANFLNPGIYHCLFNAKLTNDQNHSNDTIFTTITSVGTINTFPFTEDFNNGGSNYFLLAAAANAAANYLDTLGVNNSGCAFFTGFSSNTGWTATGVISAAAAYGTYTSHLSTLMPCSVDATGLTALRMSFDLKQMYYTQKTYTWMVLVANGTDTLSDINGVKYYNPTTTNADPFTTRTYDLSALAGTSFTLEFASACKYNPAFGAPGNNNYIDNINFWVPVLYDAGVTAVSSPVSSPCGNANDSLIATVKNFGLDTLNNIPVTVDITIPSGTHVLFNNTLVGPLAPNASAALLVAYGSTLSTGIYNIAAYSHLTGDNVNSNDTAYYSFDIYPALVIPYREDFESSTPLANWNVTNFLSGNGHGNTSHAMYATISATATKASAKMNKQKIGPITPTSYLSFDYRIVNSPNGNTGTTLTTDSVFVLISGDCGATYDTIHIIDAGNHVTSNAMKHVALPLTAYLGDDVIPGFFVKKATAGTTYFVDIDNVAVSDAAIVNLGPDTAFCPGGNITLDAGESSIGYTYTYNWSTLAHPASIGTNQSIVADSAASYIAAVNNGYGVITHDTVNVSYFPVPVVSLGTDTINCGSYILDPGTGFSSYVWSTGVSTQAITVTTTDNYTVTVTNSNGCSNTDAAYITIIPLPTVSAGPAQSICYLDTLNLINATAANYNSILWTSTGDGYFDDNALLNPKYILGVNDISNTTVTLILTNFATCDTVSSTVVVTITTTPTAFAGNDQTICSGSTAQLSATGGTTYLWSPALSLSDANIANPVASPTTTITYTVTVTSSCGIATDNVKVTVDHINPINLGYDTTLCAGLNVLLNAGAFYDSYAWSTGATSQYITVDSAGVGIGTTQVYVYVTKGVCSSSDTINITFTSCVGINEGNVTASVSVYPNPTTGLINIMVNGLNENAVLTIYTFQGQSVYSEKVTGNSTKELNLSYLSKGIYFIRINNEKTNILSKLIIQ